MSASERGAAVAAPGPLTMSDLVALEVVSAAASQCARVRWLSANDDILEGTARSIGDDQGMFLADGQDVRTGYLRITSLAGFDHYIAVTALMRMVNDGEFAIDHERSRS